jgi:hypothetical protein
MAIKINNARVDWAGYEFGLMVGGAVTDTGGYDEIKSQLAAAGPATDGARIVMRALYRTEWMEAL